MFFSFNCSKIFFTLLVSHFFDMSKASLVSMTIKLSIHINATSLLLFVCIKKLFSHHIFE
ncbi:MAG: hypothetical protein Q8S84_05635 [bacterium]|nr:hypothetical protein [bacterium]MDP3380964.1 hypothetical protein [bacterium]